MDSYLYKGFWMHLIGRLSICEDQDGNLFGL